MTTATHSPTWAADVDVCGEGQPDEYTIYSAEFGRQFVLGMGSFTREEHLRVLGWQYTSAQKDLPANEPTLEIWLGERDVIRLTLDDARKLAALLLSSADQMAATS